MASEETPTGEEGSPPLVGDDPAATPSQLANQDNDSSAEDPAKDVDKTGGERTQSDPGTTDERQASDKVAPINLSGLTKDKARDDGIPAGPPAGGAGPATPNVDAGTRTVVAVNPFSVDQTRQMIAIWLLASLFGIIAVEALFSAILGFNCWIYGMCSTRAAPAVALIANTIQPIFTAMVGLVGSVVGFYFGSQKQ